MPSLLLMRYAAVAVPVVVGVNVTGTVRVTPGWRMDPSGSGAVVLKTPAGALARVMVSGDPPVFDTVNDAVFAAPTATDPKSRVVGVRVRTGGLAPVPVRATVNVELSVVMVSDELEAVSAVGAKTAVNPTDCPAPMTVPAAGTPVTPKGAAGVVEDLMVVGLAPVFVTVTGRVWLCPTGTLPNAAVAGFAEMPVVVPVPVRATVTGPELVVTFSDPVTPPAVVG